MHDRLGLLFLHPGTVGIAHVPHEMVKTVVERSQVRLCAVIIAGVPGYHVQSGGNVERGGTGCGMAAHLGVGLEGGGPMVSLPNHVSHGGVSTECDLLEDL